MHLSTTNLKVAVTPSHHGGSNANLRTQKSSLGCVRNTTDLCYKTTTQISRGFWASLPTAQGLVVITIDNKHSTELLKLLRARQLTTVTLITSGLL
ncbi:hypothetical protein J6590_083909 [Homalodisca vitripennis]|nr:hypothetical protein J6590_083909 [Homalodisca vitripennis]